MCIGIYLTEWRNIFERVVRKYELSKNTENVENARCKSDPESYLSTTQSHSEMAYLGLPESDWRNYRYKITNETWVISFVTPARAIHLVIAAASTVYICM